jgi:hypothetical protein
MHSKVLDDSKQSSIGGLKEQSNEVFSRKFGRNKNNYALGKLSGPAMPPGDKQALG